VLNPEDLVCAHASMVAPDSRAPASRRRAWARFANGWSRTFGRAVCAGIDPREHVLAIVAGDRHAVERLEAVPAPPLARVERAARCHRGCWHSQGTYSFASSSPKAPRLQPLAFEKSHNISSAILGALLATTPPQPRLRVAGSPTVQTLDDAEAPASASQPSTHVHYAPTLLKSHGRCLLHRARAARAIFQDPAGDRDRCRRLPPIRTRLPRSRAPLCGPRSTHVCQACPRRAA
jgi:hypothetical protein